MIELGTLHGANPVKSYLKASFQIDKEFNNFDFSELLCFNSRIHIGPVKL